jgi:hypothetical protein
LQPATPQDEAFMRRTIDLAKANDKRFAAIIVANGEVIVEGINEVRGADGQLDPIGRSNPPPTGPPRTELNGETGVHSISSSRPSS